MDFATPKQEGSSIATTLEGALKQKYIKAVFATLIRNLPYNNILFSFFKEKIQQSALRYHLRKALEKSQDIESFKTNLQIRAQKANFNNATMQIIQNILKDTTQAIDEAREGAKTPTGVFTKAQEQETQQAQNKAFSASKQETQETQQAKQTQLTQEQTQLTTKTPQEIKDIISKWDLSKETNAQAKQRVIISKVSDSEKELLQKEFNFKGAKDLVREIDSHQIIHTLKQHSNEFVERQRGQEPITFDDIAQYETITQQYDLRIAQDNGRIIYAKQVNGSYVVVEEVLEGQDKIRFFDMWKQKGQINKEVLLSHSQRPNTIPSPSLESPMPSNTHNLTTKDKIKQARELGLNAKEAVHYIKTNNLPQTRANTLPQGREILEAEIVETQEIPYSQKKLIEWITNKHPKLIGSNQQARLTTKELLEFIKEENLPAKEALKLIKNTPRNLPIKIDSTSKQTTQNVDSKQIQNSHNLHTLRENAKTTLAPLINKEITNINTQEVATLTNKGIRKMTSDKAVAKSVANGFSEAEHFKAVEQVTKLFEKATKATSYTDPTDTNLTIHRYNAPFENANALLTLKEYMQDGKRMYSLELENLDAIKFNPSGKDLMEQSPKSKDIDTANFNAPSENPNAILPKNSKINTQAQNNSVQKPNKYQILRATSDYVSLKKEVMYAKQSLERRKADLQEAIKENNKETIQWAKGAIANIEKKIKSSQQDLNKEMQRIKKLGISLENPLNLKTTPMPNTKMQELQAIYKNVFPSLQSIDKAINSAKTQKEKDKLHKQRQHIINKFDKQMQTLLKDFSQERQLLMRINLTTGRQEIQELESIHFDFENPFSVYNLDKTIYRQEWGKADGNYYQTQLVEARIFFDRFEPVIRQEIKRNIIGVEDFSKGLIKDDDIFNLKTDVKNIREDIEILYNIKPLQEFGTNYAEHYHSGESAIQKLLTEAQAHKGKEPFKGQVAGAFYRKELGDIDLIWGNDKIGLQKIVEKHLNDFAHFAGNNPYEKMSNAINEIIQNGKLLTENGVNTLWYKNGDEYYLVGISKGFNKQGDNNWIVTSYKKTKGKIPDEIKGNTANLSAYSDEFNPLLTSKDEPLNSKDIIPQTTQKSLFDTPKLESNLNDTLESYKAHETATTQLKRSIFEKENELKDLVAEKEKIQQWAETIKEQGNSRALTKIAKELEKIGFDTFSKHPMLDYEVSKVKKVNPRLDGQQFYDESTIINFKDLKKFIKSRDDFIKFKDKLDTLYLADSPYGQARYIHKIKDFSNTKQVGFYQAFNENNYDNIIKELIDKETSKVKNTDNDKIISLQKELEQLKERLEKTNQSLAQSERELEQIPFLQKFFNNKPLFGDFLFLRFNTMSEKEIKEQAQKASIDIDISRSYFEKALNITPIKEFGANYAEHYHSGQTAIQKLLAEAQAHKQSGAKGEYKGQVAGAFYRKELGDIDLVWGEVTGSGKEAKGWGLAKIIEKHLNAGDFKAFGEGQQGLINAINQIIQDGKVVTQNGVDSIVLRKNGEEYRVGISKGWDNVGENKWIITSYKNNKYKESAETSYHDTFTSKEPLENPVSSIIPQESKSIKEEEIKEFLKNNGEQINSNYPQETATLILQQNKDNGIVLSGFEIKGKDYDPQLEVLEFKSKKAQREFETLMKSYDTKGDFLKFEKMAVFKPNDEAFLQYLKKYKDDKNAKLALAYNLSKDLIRMQGGGRLEVFMTNFLRQIHILENQNSTIYQSNPHIGAGLLGGSVNGLEQDENGNLTFSPEKFALGLLGGAVGSKAVAQGFKYLKENPQVKEAVVKELADTLALGFEKAREKYPLLSLLQPRYMVQNQRGRSILQAKSMLKELEKEQRGLYNVVYNGKNATMIKQDLESVENAIRFAKGNKNKGAKHIAIEHLTDPSKEGYITDLELVNLGKSIRQYLAKYKEPFIDTNGARIYEWEKDGVRFRAVVNNIKGEGNSNLPQLSKPLNDDIITFYSDRNLKEAMEFKNPVLKQTIIDVKKMQKAREKEYFYSTFSLQDVLDNTFIKLNNIEDRYYGSIQIDPNLKEGEYHISSNQLYLNKADFNKNKISDEAIRDFLKSLRLLENNNNELWEAHNIAYKHNIPLSRAKKVMQEQKQYQKEIPLFKEAREHFKEFEPRKIKDLLEWHKDSSALTKDEQGLPRVFYHGSTSGKKITEFDREFDKSGWGFWFSPIRAVSAGFAKHSKPQAVFLKLEKPFDMTKGVDFDLMLKEELFFGKEQIEELKPEFKKIQKIYKGLLQDLDKQGIKPIEFFHDGSFYGIRNNKLGFFNDRGRGNGRIKRGGIIRCGFFSKF